MKKCTPWSFQFSTSDSENKAKVIHPEGETLGLLTHRWNIITIADGFGQQPVAYLPCEYAWTLALVISYFIHHVLGSYSRLRSTYCPRLYGAGFVISERR